MAKQTVTLIDCPKCDGEGYIREYAFIQDGRCFKCGGSGKIAAPKPRKLSPKQLEQKAAKEAKRKAEADAYQAMQQAAMNDPRVINSPRMRVTPDHPYFYMHAVEVYQWHEKYGWDAK